MVLVTLALDKSIAEMLAELAGSKSTIPAYLTLLITKLHAEQQGQDSDGVLETLTQKVQALYESHIAAQQKVCELSKRITNVISGYQELLAIVELLTVELAYAANSTHTDLEHGH